MKNASIKFILATILGIAVLVFTAMYFGVPPFGSVISGAIVLVFAISMVRYRKVYLHLESEEELLAQYQKQGTPEPIGTGVVAERIRRVRDLALRGVYPDSRIFSEILSARESSTMSRSPGSITILLGLAGTFFGLMLAISTAGNALDAVNPGSTLAAISGIFSTMKGIFGTSFCGIAAALFLNATHSVVSSRKLSYMADVEEYTQLILLPAFAAKGDNSEEVRRNALVEQLSQMVSALQNGLQTQMSKVVESMSHNLETVTKASLERLEKSESAAAERLEALQKQTAQGLERTIADALQRIESSTGTLVQGVSKSTAESIAKQTDESKTQWTAAIETVRAAMLQNAEQGKTAISSVQALSQQVADQGQAALDGLQSIAHKVSEQADARAIGLAQNVGAQVEQLAHDVQASFGMLAQSSRELVDSQRVLLDEIEKRQVRERELSETLGNGIGEAATLMRVNQSEFQASLELFRQGIESLLEKFTGNSAEQESQRTFIEQLQATLEAFSEKASEVLVENAMRTQEILLELLDQSKNAPAPEARSEQG